VMAVRVMMVGVAAMLRAGVRAVLSLVRPGDEQKSGIRSPAAHAVASAGGFLLCLMLLLVAGDLLITWTFRPDVPRVWLAARDLLFLAAGAGLCWLLAGPAARRVDGWLVRLGDPRGWRVLLVVFGLLLAVAVTAPLAGAATPRFEQGRAGPPAELVVDDTGLDVIVFAVDGATWDVFGPLLEGGQLPATAKLVERGVRATPVSPPPQVSPAIWTTMVTGRPPDEHGVHEYLLVDFPGLVKFPFEALADDLAVVPFFFVGLGYFGLGLAEGIPPTSGQVRTKTLWHMLADAGQASLVLGWPCTWPAEEVPGLIVSDRYGPNEFDVFSTPQRNIPAGIHPAQAAGRIQSIMEEAGGDPRAMLRTLTDMDDAKIEELLAFRINPMLPAPASLLATAWEADNAFLDVMESELRRSSQRGQAATNRPRGTYKVLPETSKTLLPRYYRLALVMINGPDMAMHAFWRHRFPEDFGLDEAPRPAWGRIIDAVHRQVDRRMARVLAAAGEETVAVVISDHGMAASPESFVWDGNHAPEALFIMAGGPVRAGLVLDEVSYRDVAPTILYLLGLPVPDDLGGRVLTRAIDAEFLREHPLRTIPSYEGRR